ncbi:MAG: MCE family protein [Rhodobacteraceae bacterium]|nr:MAG: MCE family protein [Paracoccaceae bacterium]
METRANYLLIGIFTLAAMLGTLGLFLWFAKVEIDRQYAYYDILFENVSGLGAAGDVRYNGLPVGQVVDLRFDEADSSRVRIRIEVRADTPVNTETVAQLQAQGVTGVSFVALSGGSPDAQRLPDGAVIPSERSALQSVFEGAPVLLEKAVSLLEDINTVFDDANREAIATILSNTASASERLDTTLTNLETLSDDLGAAAREVAEFTDRLDSLADTAETTLETGHATLETARATFEGANRFIAEDLPGLTADLREANATVTRVLGQAGEDLSQAVATFDDVAETTRTMLVSAEAAFTDAIETLDRIDAAMVSAEDTLGTARQTFASANDVLENDIDAMITDLRGAVTSFTGTLDRASDDIGSIAEEARAASAAAASFLETLDTLVTENRRQVSDFLALGLPQFLRLTEEARALVINLERLANRVERDPGRFLLGTNTPEFRR